MSDLRAILAAEHYCIVESTKQFQGVSVVADEPRQDIEEHLGDEIWNG